MSDSSTPPHLSETARSALSTLATHTSGSGEDKQQTISDTAIINLCLLFLDEKPLTEVTFSMPPDKWTSITDNEVCNLIADLGLHYATRASIERVEGAYVVVSVDVCPTQEAYHSRLRPQPSAEIARRNGHIYGYPTEAIDAFVEFYAEGNDAYAKAQSEYEWELLESGAVTPGELAYQTYLNWVPSLTIESLDAAIEEGQRRYELLIDFARENDLPVVANRVRGAYEIARWDYAHGNRPEWIGEEGDGDDESEA